MTNPFLVRSPDYLEDEFHTVATVPGVAYDSGTVAATWRLGARGMQTRLALLRNVIVHEAYAGAVQNLPLFAGGTSQDLWRIRTDSVSVSEFASLVKEIAEVSAVHVSYDGNNTHVWTYLDAEPFQSATRYLVYEAEEVVLRRYPRATVDFHLVNLSEYPLDDRENAPRHGELVYQRRG